MGGRGRVRLNDTCWCGHLYARTTSAPEDPAHIRRAIARAEARVWVGHDAPFAGVAIYQAITENA